MRQQTSTYVVNQANVKDFVRISVDEDSFQNFKDYHQIDSISICRICHEDHVVGCNPICACTGAISVVHKKCLENWLKHSNATHCEFCGYTYKFQVESPSFWLYLQKGLLSTPRHVAMLVIPLLFFTVFVFMFTLMACDLWWELNGGNKRDSKFSATHLSALLVIFFLVFIFCVVKSMRLHVHQWKQWREENPAGIHLKTDSSI